VVGKNDGWKQEVNMGKRNNQNFVQIPHARLIQQLGYKGADVAILVVPNEESYTSQASFLDRDPMPVWPDRPATPFSGRRVRTKLYRSAGGVLLHADVNGAGNILRKVVPDSALADGGIGDAVVYPVALGLPRLLPQRKSRGLGRERREPCLI